MKIINSDTGFLMYQKIFGHLQANNCSLVVWQVEGETGRRSVSESRLNSYHMESKLLHLAITKSQVPVDRNLPVYCYAEDGQLIFKTSIHEVRDNVFSVAIPPEIKLLEDPECIHIRGQMGLDLNSDVLKVKRLAINGLRDEGPDYLKVKSMAQRTSRDQKFLSNEFNPVSLDEEDKLFAGKREAPRARPKVDKWVKVKLVESESIHRMKLFDLSQGGMSFVSNEIAHFPKGSVVHLLGFDEFDLDDPMIAQVMSHRAIDEAQLEWKIGCKFDDGQG